MKPSPPTLRSLVIAGAAVLAHLPVFRTWWCLDDWGQLARAADHLERTGPAVRWLSQDLWWSATWPLFGLSVPLHTAARLTIFAASAAILGDLTARATGRDRAGILAGTLFAVSPVVFTPLFWASGIQTVLGAGAAIAAAWAWWRPRRRWAAALALVSIFAKECGLGLPLLFGLDLAVGSRSTGTRRREDAVLVAVLALAAGVEAWLVLNGFAHGPGDAYRLGGPAMVAGNLGVFGWWLATPGPVFSSSFDWSRAGTGGLVFVAWAAWGLLRWRRGDRLPATALVAALISLAPALPLVQQTHPYLATIAAAALATTLGAAAPRVPFARRPVTALVVGGLVALGVFNTAQRCIRPREDGRPADPVVNAASWSRLTAAALAPAGPGPVVIYQPALSGPRVAEAARRGRDHVQPSPAWRAMEGTRGVDLVLGAPRRSAWWNSLADLPADAWVLCETPDGFERWGPATQALAYAAILDLVVDQPGRARAHLLRFRALGLAADLYHADPAGFDVPVPLFTRGAAAFRRHLRADPGEPHVDRDLLAILATLERRVQEGD
ncbi:hypothetical protein KDM41_14455 [bacterium]|nr:hypothetical protein [bacterium]